MTEYHYLFLIALGLLMFGWGARANADDDVTIYKAPSAARSVSSTAHVAIAPDGSPVIHKSLHLHKRNSTGSLVRFPILENDSAGVTDFGSAEARKRKDSGTSSIVLHSLSSNVPTVIVPTPSSNAVPTTVTVDRSTGDSRTQITISTPSVPEPSSHVASGGPARPEVETGLPIARPGFEKSTVSVGTPLASTYGHKGMSSSLFPPITSSVGLYGRSLHGRSDTDDFTFTNFDHRVKNFYPWKRDIITTMFWIGEGSTSISSTDNVASAWDQDWTHNNGGTDSPTSRDGYDSKHHVDTINPFYVALPFNDLAFPDKARRWLPAGWYRAPRNGRQVSACKDRWVEIKNEQGEVCYAQWEDVGPLRYDHAEYVFGDERPNTYTRAGLDVSPAVADYLRITERNRYTSWRFVDDADVPPGEWLKYDEQALLYRAMHNLNDRNDPTRIRPIQDATAPIDDPSDIESNKRKVGSAKG